MKKIAYINCILKDSHSIFVYLISKFFLLPRKKRKCFKLYDTSKEFVNKEICVHTHTLDGLMTWVKNSSGISDVSTHVPLAIFLGSAYVYYVTVIGTRSGGDAADEDHLLRNM